jgi:hypothetical protein
MSFLTKTLITNKCTRELYRKTLLHVSTLLGHLQGELSADREEFTPPKTKQYTANSIFFLKCEVQPQCNSKEKFSLKMNQQDRNM